MFRKVKIRHDSNTDTTQRVLRHYTTLIRQDTTENNSHAQDTIALGPIYTELEYVGYCHLYVYLVYASVLIGSGCVWTEVPHVQR